jgi:tetratricopeptide (TPR) repeat protein
MKRYLILVCCLLPLGLGAASWEQGIKSAVAAHRKGDLKKAEEMLLKTMLQAEQFGEDDPRLAYTLDYLGTINMQANQPDKAEPMFLRSLKIFEKDKGQDSEPALASLGKLAESYDQRQLWTKSEPLYRRIVEANKADAAQRSVDLNNLAVSIDAQDRQDEALKLYQEALALREASLGSISADLPELLNNQARVYYMKGDFGAAEKLYLRSIDIDLKAKSPLLADDYLRLAPLYRKQGREAEAKELEAKALVIQTAAKKKAKHS